MTRSRDQVGERLWMYAWYHFADDKNDKSFLEPWNLSVGRVAVYRTSPYSADVKNGKAVFGTAVRGVGRGRFQRQRVILREPEGRVEVLRRRKGVYAVRSKTETCDSRLRDMRRV